MKKLEKLSEEHFALLGSAFDNNLSVNRYLKQDDKRVSRLRGQIKYVARLALKNAMAFSSDDGQAIALCVPSPGKKASVWHDLVFIFTVSGLKKAKGLLKREKLLKGIIPDAPLVHLWLLAVSSPNQRKGHGSGMLREIQQMAKTLQLPIYLETSNPDNIPFYEKQGFRIYYATTIDGDSFRTYFFRWYP
jgi:ribosomal protein S18 acetylase RimI-like enzyme